MQNEARKDDNSGTAGAARVVVLGTGGTIAGRAASAGDHLGYRAGEVAVQDLVAAVPALQGLPLEVEQVAQVDSKNMDPAIWQALARRAAAHLARDEVAGVVVTHGTDTLEETAWLLQRVLAPTKPLVLTAAMRPATSLQADGPQNLADAVAVARWPDARGVLAVLGGAVHAAAELRKVHTLRLEAFDSGDAGPLARLDGGVERRLRAWPAPMPGLGLAVLARPADQWPWVAVLANHAGADGREVRALVAAGVQGLVVAGTGHGTLSDGLAAALADAQAGGVLVSRASRCARGPVAAAGDDPLPAAGERSPWQARVDLLLTLLARG